MASIDQCGYVTLDSENNPGTIKNNRNKSIWINLVVIAIAITCIVLRANAKTEGKSASDTETPVSIQSETSVITDERADYILPYSDSSFITYSDLEKLSEEDVVLARNEIYAHRGRIFNNTDIRNYYESKEWYAPLVSPEEFSEGVFNEYEISNVYTIVRRIRT